MSSESRGTARKYSLSDEQLQELVRFFVWLHSRPSAEELAAERSWTADEWDASHDHQKSSKVINWGCEDDLDLSQLQLKALRRRCEDRNSHRSGVDVISEPGTPKFGSCSGFVSPTNSLFPDFIEDFSLSDEQLDQLAQYYRWYQDAFTDAPSRREPDFGLSAETLQELRVTCEHGIMSSPSIGNSEEKAESNTWNFGLSDIQLQTLVCFHIWSRSQVSSISCDSDFGLSSDQVEDIQKYYGWCQVRNRSLHERSSSSGASKEQPGERLGIQDNAQLVVVVDESTYCELLKLDSQPQPKALPTNTVEVSRSPITDEHLQDLVSLFIWRAVASDGADKDGCDDDLDLPQKQLEQLRGRCDKAEGQGAHAQADDAELESLVEVIGIEKEHLQTVIQYCVWTCTLEAKRVMPSVTQLKEARTECEAQGLTCSWTSLHEGMEKVCNVSDERLQNLMRFYMWRCSTLGSAQLDEFGLPDEDFEELIRYLSWCESRAMATGRTPLINHDTGYSCHQTPPSLTPELPALGGVPLNAADTLPTKVCCPSDEVLTPGGLCTIQEPSEDGSCSSFAFSFTSSDEHPCRQSSMIALAGSDNGEMEEPGQGTNTGAASGCKEASEESIDHLRKAYTDSIDQLLSGLSEDGVSPRQDANSAHHMASSADSVMTHANAGEFQAMGLTLTRCQASPSRWPGRRSIGTSDISWAQEEADVDDMFSGDTLGAMKAVNLVYTSKQAFAFQSHSSPSRTACDKAKISCSAAQTADTWEWPLASWQDIKVASSSWLNDLSISSCHRDNAGGLCQSTRDTANGFYVESTDAPRQIVEI